MADKEKLIEAVGSFQFPIESCGCTIGEYIVPYSIQEPLVDHLIASGVVVSNSETTTKWIPVTERLPDNNERVLVYHDDGIIRFGINKGGFADVVSTLYLKHSHRTCFSKVTHWMHLPPAPEGE